MVSLKEIPYKIALYIRVSTEEQAESPEGSIKNQEERLRRTVRDKIEDGSDAQIVGVFIDAGLSGKDTNRPQLQKMLARIRRGEINLVMVTELSRLSRNTKDFSEMWEVFHQYNCEFHSLREKFDTTNAAGEMMLHMMINFAQFERRQTAERIAASFRVRAERGLYNGGAVPLGYRIPEDKSGKLLVHEEEAEIVRTAFKAFLNQGSLSAAATWLNENNIRLNRKMIGGGRPRTGHFLFESLQKILRNKAYIGIRVYRTNEGLKETKAAWPAIVDDITFQRVQEILTKNYRRKKPTKPNRYPYQLTSLIVCGVCGDRLCGKSAWGKRKKIPYYEHSWTSKIQNALPEKVYTCKPHRIPGTIAENIVWREVEAVLTNPMVAEGLILEAKAIHAKFDNSHETDRLKNKIYGVTAQIDALTERLSQLPMEISAEPIYKQMKKLELQKQDLEVKHYELKNHGATQDLPVSLSKYDEFLKAITTWKPYETPTPEQKRKVIERLVDKIEIYPDEIKINFIMGSSKIERELTLIGSLSNPVKTVTKPLAKYLKTQCSTSLTVGGPRHWISEHQNHHDFIELSPRTPSRIYEECAPLYESGLSIRDIEERTGIPKSTVRETLKKNGMALRNPLNGNAIHIDRLHTKRGGHTPYGYAYLDGKLLLDPKEQIIVRKILKLHQSGLSGNAIAKELNHQQIPSRTGKSWSPCVVRRIIKLNQSNQPNNRRTK